MTKRMTAALLTVMGFLFTTAYIRSATADVVYTDYIRLINTYLPNVLDPSPYLHADTLERIPITYLERLFNVRVLGYSTTFDMMLGAAGLAACAAVVGKYCIRQNVRLVVIPILMFIIFSLDKWEMLTNGTGWMHFWAVALFYAHFTLYDRVRGGCRERAQSCRGDVGGYDIREDAGAHDTGRSGGGCAGDDKVGGTTALRTEDGIYRRRERLLLILPALIIFLIAGPYCAAYAGCVCLIYIADCVTEMAGTYRKQSQPQPQQEQAVQITDADHGQLRAARKQCGTVAEDANMHETGRTIRRWAGRFASILLPFGLYFLSHMSVEYEYAGVTSMSIRELVASDPAFLAELFIRSFTGLVMTAETAQAAGISDSVLLCEGLVILIAYIVSIVLNVRSGLYKKSAFPMMLMVMALLSHGLITASRWIFLDPTYTMSSRYALQYMGGSVGMLLTLFYACGSCQQIHMLRISEAGIDANRQKPDTKHKKSDIMRGASGSSVKEDEMKYDDTRSDRRGGTFHKREKGYAASRAFTCGICALILAGQLMNYAQEIHMAPYRREAFEHMRQVAVSYEERTDEELKSVLQYRDPTMTRRALTILKENGWNVFRR